MTENVGGYERHISEANEAKRRQIQRLEAEAQELENSLSAANARAERLMSVLRRIVEWEGHNCETLNCERLPPFEECCYSEARAALSPDKQGPEGVRMDWSGTTGTSEKKGEET